MGIYPELNNYDISQIVKEYEQQVTTVEPGYYYTSDHLGSSSYITDDNGDITQTLAYLPYGEDWVDLKHNNPQYQTPYKFNGKEKDEESGYHYYGARYLNNDLSIWLSVDPMSDKYPSTSSYAYCRNNPVILVDPDGMSDDWFMNDKTGDVYYNSEMKKGDEGKGPMKGDGWMHMGENGMFQKGQSNKDSDIVRNKGGSQGSKYVAGNLRTWTGSLYLEGDKAKSFMSDMGYKYVKKDYIYNENVQKFNIPEPHTITTLTTDNSSSQVLSYQYVRKGRSPSTQIKKTMEERVYTHPLYTIKTSKSLRRDTYNGYKINSEHVVKGTSLMKDLIELWRSR